MTVPSHLILSLINKVEAKEEITEALAQTETQEAVPGSTMEAVEVKTTAEITTVMAEEVVTSVRTIIEITMITEEVPTTKAVSLNSAGQIISVMETE